jgi:hypothetical protein
LRLLIQRPACRWRHPARRSGSSDWINAEDERAKKIHSGDEAEAITELLIRSRAFPEQRTRMITMTAVNIIAASRLPPG